jgi:hypothetical protein
LFVLRDKKVVGVFVRFRAPLTSTHVFWPIDCIKSEWYWRAKFGIVYS